MNLFSRTPDWLRKALDTSQPVLPNKLDTTSVLPVVDIFRGGVDRVKVEALQLNKAASLGATVDTLVPWGMPNVETRLLLAIEAQANGYAAAPTTELRLRAQNTGAGAIQVNVGAYLHDGGAPPLGNVGHLHEYAGDNRPIWIPPTWGMTLSIPATGVGESWVVQYVVVTLPHGSELGL